jgi:hypothetical protein
MKAVMSKYTPLGDYLRKQRMTRVPMTFAEIERLIGAKLPNSQRYPAWWSNNPFNNVMTQVWLDAGFKTEEVDVESRKLVFRRVGEAKPSSRTSRSSDNVGTSKPHPLIGWMKGAVRVAPGVDLTEPADPEWGKRTWGDEK